MNVYNYIQSDVAKLAVLIDPDRVKLNTLDEVLSMAVSANVDMFLVGGSLIVYDMLEVVIDRIKTMCDIPVILFPGNVMQLNKNADALLYLSLISGRNPDLLIGNHVVSAPFIKQHNLEAIATGYILVDGGRQTTVSYMSNTQPIPADKYEIASCTALAGELLGMKQIYLDAGSGATQAVNLEMIRAVSEQISVPLIVGGGIRSAKQASDAVRAGANVIVVGTAFEHNPALISEIADAIHSHADQPTV